MNNSQKKEKLYKSVKRLAKRKKIEMKQWKEF